MPPSACRLVKDGLPPDVWSEPARSFIAAGSKGGLEAVVAVIKNLRKEEREREERRTKLNALASAEGLQGRSVMHEAVATAYIQRGEGTVAEVVAVWRARRDAAAVRAARSQRMRELLAEGQLPAHYLSYYVPAIEDWVQRGEGSEQAALAAARLQFEEAEAARLAREQRQARVSQLLAAEQLPDTCLTRVYTVSSYIDSCRGSEAAAMQAARAWHQQQLEQEQRRERVRQLLEAEGLPTANSTLLSASGVSKYIARGEGTEAEAVAAARAHHDLLQARQQREAALTELLAAEGLELAPYRWTQGVCAWIEQGTGSEQAAVAAAKAASLVMDQEAYLYGEQDYLNEYYWSE